jgi:hypothetical protein
MFVDLFSFLGTLLSLALSWLAMDCAAAIRSQVWLCFASVSQTETTTS